MRCPHCAANLLYRERGGQRCSKCKQKFAFEPKTSPLKLHDLRFRRIVQKISADGTIWYTPSQLHHALARKVVKAKTAWSRSVGCLVGIIIVAIVAFVIALQFASGFVISVVLFVTIGGLLLLTISWLRPVRLGLPMAPEKFQNLVIGRWYRTYDTLPEGLITSKHPASISPYVPPATQLTAVIACPERDILLCLQANGVPQQYGVGLLPTEGTLVPDEEMLLTTLRAQPDLPLFLLHDASLAGMLLPQTIGMSLGLRAEHRIVDLGLRPSQALKYNLMRLGEKPAPELLSILTRQMNTTTGAKAPLSIEEFKWLKKGYHSPILAVNPVRLLRVVHNAMTEQRQHLQRSKSVDPEQQAQQQAQAVGFMSWPK